MFSRKRSIASSFVLAILLFIVFGCKQDLQPKIGFYYWKNSFKLSPILKSYLDSTQASRLYVKFLDIGLDQAIQVVPLTKLQGLEHLGIKQEIVPCIYLVNAVFQEKDTLSVKIVAKNTAHLLREMLSIASLQAKEIQLDCDWSASSKSGYFAFVKYFKQYFPQTVISVTVRLHQFKYQTKSGIPPADKGLLMCYNLSQPTAYNWTNAIFDSDVALSYLKPDAYPLKLDFAFPVFKWVAWFHKRKFKVLINGIGKHELLMNKAFVNDPVNPTRFVCVKTTQLSGYALSVGDELRCDEGNFADVKKIISALPKQKNSSEIYLNFFALDEQLINHIPYATYQDFSANFN